MHKIINHLKKLGKPNILFACSIAAVIVILAVVYVIYTQTHYTKEFYQITSNQIVDRVRVVFLSDLHQYEYGDSNEKLVDDIKSLKPDLIISGGDLVSYGKSSYDEVLTLCEKLSDIAPFYGVMGNHEMQVYLKKDKGLCEKFRKAGLNLLVNQTKTITVSGNELELVGLAGGDAQFEKDGAKTLMDSLDDKYRGYRICIAHVPILFSERLSDYSFNLGLAGHVHGGLIDIPRIGALYSDEEGFFPEYYAGMHHMKNSTLIISRGMGDSNIVPRINNPHELSVIDLKLY